MRLTNTEFAVFEPHDCKISSWFDKYDNVSFRPTPLSSQIEFANFFAGFDFGLLPCGERAAIYLKHSICPSLDHR